MKFKIHKKNKLFIFNFFSFFLTFFLVIFTKIFNFRFVNFDYFFVLIPIISLFITKNIFNLENILSNIKKKSIKSSDFLNIFTKLSLIFLFSVFFLVFIFSLNIFIGKIFGKIQFSNDFEILKIKYLNYFSEKNLLTFQNFSENLGVNFFWASNVLTGIIFGLTFSSFIFFMELSVWLTFVWDELKLMTFWQKNIYIGFIRGIIHSQLVFVGNFGETNNSLIFGIITLFFNVFYFPIIGIIFKNFKSIFYPAIFSGLIFSLSEMATFFIVGCDKFLIDVKGLIGIFGLIIIDVILYFDYNIKIKLIKNKMIHKINK